MFGRKPYDGVRDVLNNPTIPRFYFSGLALDDSDFVLLKDLIDFEKREVYAKLLKLRDISNSMIGKEGYIVGVQYDEKEGPRLNLVLSESASDSFAITQSTRMGGRTLNPSYAINEDILNYLLDNKNLKSKLDMMFVNEYIEELTAFREALLDGTFYPNYSVKDTTGEFDVSVSHDGYSVNHVKDSIEIPFLFGRVVASRAFSGGYELYYDYSVAEQKAGYSTNIDKTGNIANADKILYLHKKLLPEAVQKKLK